MEKKQMRQEQKEKRYAKRSILAGLLILLVIPVTIYVGWRYADRRYYITSLLIIIYTMIPFFLVFEKRKPQAREIVVIAVLSAIAVVSRALFIWIPHFKPITGIIIIAGIGFGPEAGFLTGALAGFASNFIFGQGPWTPWQMFAFGIAGFLAGLFRRGNFVRKKGLPLGIFGGLLVIFVVGPLLDTCSLFTMVSKIDWNNARLIYLSGIPVNGLHATATLLTLLFFADPTLEKLERIKTKYGMMEDKR